MTNKLDATIYINFFKDDVLSEGKEVADSFNKRALANNVIDIDTYLKAAHMIVDQYVLGSRA